MLIRGAPNLLRLHVRPPPHTLMQVQDDRMEPEDPSDRTEDERTEAISELASLADRTALCGRNHALLLKSPNLLRAMGFTSKQTLAAYTRIAEVLWDGEALDPELRSVAYALGVSHPDPEHPDGRKFDNLSNIGTRRGQFMRTVGVTSTNTVKHRYERHGFAKLFALLQPAGDKAELRYFAENHEVLWVFTKAGSKELHVTRTIRAAVDGLEVLTDRYGGSGTPSIQYSYVAVYGCTIESNEIVSTQTNAVQGTIRLSKPLRKGDRHTYQYRIEVSGRHDPSAVEVLNSYVTSVHRPEYRVDRAVLRVRFADNVPAQAWVLSGTTLYEIPGKLTATNEVPIYEGCLEYEFLNLRPGLHYSICWEWPVPSDHKDAVNE